MQQKNKLLHFIVLIVMLVSLCISPAQPAAAQRDDGLQRNVNAESGKVSFISTATGEPVSIMQSLGLPAGDVLADPARALIQKFGSEFGLRDPASELTEVRTLPREDGRLSVRYQQTYQGIPVIGGELIVNTNELGDLYSISGEVSQDLSLSTEPVIAMEDAQSTALRMMAKYYGGAAADYVSSEPELWVFDDSLLGAGTRPVALVWRMDVTVPDSSQPIRQLVLIDAHTGKIVLTFNQVDTAWQARSSASTKPAGSSAPMLDYPNPTEPFGVTRITKDANNNTAVGDDSILCSNQMLNCTSGADLDADAAHANAGLVWAFYNAKHGRNSINNAGMSITSVVHYDSGYANAFWDNNTMVYGDGYGFAYADDVIGHELTHGVTEYESSLLYYYQSGAINESLSDLWGEYFDQTNGRGTDTNAVKWLIGEDVTDLGVMRNMSKPTAFGDPDSMTSPLYYIGEEDNGGVHSNSGVNNKAVYLMVNGGTFNDKTVNGIGWDKTAAIYYEAQTSLLGTGTNYSDLYYAVQQSCRTLTGGAQGITLDDCLNVNNALDAVRMNTPINLKHLVTAPLCPSGQVPSSTPLFEDEMEGLLTTKWNVSSRWFTSTHIASSPTHSAFGDPSAAGYNNETMTMKNAVLIQPNTFLHFAHAYDFDYNGIEYYDGGVLEYSTNGGTSWIDAGTLYSAGANYDGILLEDNPLAGRMAFVGSTYSSYSYYYEHNPPYEPAKEISMVSSRFNLSSLAGKNVKLRFRFTTDSLLEFIGWHIDDVQVYTCIGAPVPPALKLPANGSLVKDYTPLLDWADSAPVVNRYRLQVSTDPTFATTLYDEPNLLSSHFQVPADLAANTKYYWRVRAYTVDSGTNWSPTWTFRTVFLPPVPVSPADNSIQLTRRPTLTWTNPNPGLAPTNYTVQVSAFDTFIPVVHTGTATSTNYAPAVDLPGGTKLYWRVRANGGNGPSNYSSVRSFNTPASTPSIPTLTSPENSVLLTSYQPAFLWTVPAGSSVDHFNIQIDNNSNFSSPEINQSTGSAVPGFTPGSPLSSNVVLYWRVQTVDSLGVMSGWSPARNVRMAITPPTLVSPADDALVTALRPTFDWNDVPQATGYTVQFSLNSSFSPLLHSGSPVVSQYVPTIDLPKGVTIYWRVRTRGLVGPSAFTPLLAADSSITTPSVVPAVPTLTAPPSNFLTKDYSPELKWTMPATSPPYDHFIVQIDNNAAFSSPEVENTAASSPFVPSADLASNTRFYWRVRAVNGATLGSRSAVRNFRTALLPPSNLSPADNTAVTELRPLFNWDDVLHATGYTIQFSLSDTFSPIFHTGNPVTSEYIPTVDLPKGATIYWRVITRGPNGPSAFTPTIANDRTITTPAAVPGMPTLSAPALNFLTKDYTPTFTWTMPATSSSYDRFYLQIDNNANFSSPEVNIQNNSIIIPTYTPVMNLAPNTRFYWRVRAVSGTIMGNWSAARYFRTALEVPLLLSPTDGSTPAEIAIVYNWTDVSGAAGYNIQISLSSTFTHILTNANTVHSVYAPTTGYCSSTLYWRVRATGANGPGGWSPTFSFTAAACPFP